MLGAAATVISKVCEQIPESPYSNWYLPGAIPVLDTTVPVATLL